MSIIDFQIIKNVVSFDISGVRIDLFEKAIVCVIFKCNNGEIIVRDVVIQGDTYLQWGSDDNFIVNYITDNISNILTN